MNRTTKTIGVSIIMVLLLITSFNLTPTFIVVAAGAAVVDVPGGNARAGGSGTDLSGDPCSWNQSGGQYCLLAPLGNYIGQGGKLNIYGGGLSQYLNALFKMGIVIATGLAVIMISMGGLKYVSTDAVGGKSEGKEMIQQALLGLVLALMAVLILNQINPALLKSDLNIAQTVKVGGIQTSNIVLVSDREDDNHNTRSTNVDPAQAREDNWDDPAYSYDDAADNDRYDLEDAYPGVYSKAGQSTHFGYKDKQDNGMGAPVLNPNLEYGPVKQKVIQKDGTYYAIEVLGIITNDTEVKGVALPQNIVRSALGITGNSREAYAPARRAGVRVVNRAGEDVIVPIVDFGPGPGPQSEGKVIDETEWVSKKLGRDGYREYTIIPNYFPDRT